VNESRPQIPEHVSKWRRPPASARHAPHFSDGVQASNDSPLMQAVMRLRSWLFGPTNLRGGRIQVWGCSPGCILLSLVVSVILTLLLNLLLNLIF
jgi:hypothetical protein